MTVPLNPAVAEVTARIVERSRGERGAYLQRIEGARRAEPARGKLSCANWAHAFAASPDQDKARALGQAPNIGIVTAYNDMLSAHQPLEHYPEVIRQAARDAGATAQVAGGVPAMCDGVTQGQPGMELSLFSRDVIAMATAVALTHDAFDGALCLGVCDKIVPGLVIGSLAFGHLPVIFVPAGPSCPAPTGPTPSPPRPKATSGPCAIPTHPTSPSSRPITTCCRRPSRWSASQRSSSNPPAR